MASTYNELIDRSIEVAKETEEKANTASRVGYLLRDIVNYANTNIQKNSSDIYSLQGRVTNLEQKDYDIDEIRELSEQNASDIDRIDRDIIDIEAQSVSAMQKSTQAINTVNALSVNVQSNTNAINTLNGDETTEGSVAYQIAQIIADAPEAFDTLKEIADWIAEHPEDTAAMNAQIQQNTSDIARINTQIEDVEVQSNKVGALEDYHGDPTTDVESYTSVKFVNDVSNNFQQAISSLESSVNAELSLKEDKSNKVRTQDVTGDVLSSEDKFLTAAATNSLVTGVSGDVSALTAQVNSNTSNIATNTVNIATNTSDITSLKTSVGTNTSNIAALRVDVNGNIADILAIEQKIADYKHVVYLTQAEYDALEVKEEDKLYIITDLTANCVKTEEFNLLESRVSSNETQIGTNTSDIASLQNTVSGHTTSIATNASDISDLQSTVSRHTTSIATNASDIASLQTTVSGHTTSIATNTSDIAALQTTVSGHTTSIANNASDIATLQTTVGGHTTSIANNASDISDLQTTVSGHTTSIATNASDIASLQTTVSGHTTSIATNTSDISDLQTTVSGHTTSIATHTTQIASNTDAINTLNGDETTEGSVAYQIAQIIADAPEAFDTLKEIADWIAEHPEDTAAMNAQIQQNTANIATNASDIATLQTTVGGHTTSIATNASDIATLQTTVGGHTTSIATNASDIATLQTTVSGHTTSIANNASDIASLQTTVGEHTTGIANNASDISDLQTTVSGHTTSIANNASDISDLQTTVSGHTTSIATNTSDIASLQTTVSGHTTSLSLKENLSNKSAEYNSENASSTDIYPSMAAITGILTSISNTYEVLTNKLADLSTYQGNVQTDTDTYLSIKAVYQALDTFRQGLNSVFESKSGQSTFLNNATITAADNMMYVGSENISALTVNSTNSMDYSVEFNTVSTSSALVTVTFSNVNWGDDVPSFEPGMHYICYVHNNYGTYKAYAVA